MKHGPIIATALIASICLCTNGADARKKSPALPETAQVPVSRPGEAIAPTSEAIVESSPPATPPPTQQAETQTEKQTAPTSDIPIPVARPADPAVDSGQRRAPEPEAAATTDSAELRAEEACRSRLAGLKVEFKAQAALSDELGCSVPFPLAVSSFGPGLAVEPAATLNCPMAEAAARFTQSVIKPTAREVFGSELTAIANASAYVCRPRNGSEKLSEHAFGNALDMASFRLADGRTIDVKATDEAKPLAFLAKLRKAACGPFKTVLGPGSDADHATHFHVDLAHRRSGATFCQ